MSHSNIRQKKWFILISDIYKRFIDDEIAAVGAQTSYYLLLSIFPLLIFISTLASYLYIGPQSLIDHLKQYTPPTIIPLIKTITTEILAKRSNSVLSISILFTLWIASGGVSAIIHGLNKAYDQKSNRFFWKSILTSMLLTLTTAIGFLISLTLLVFGQSILNFILKLTGIYHLQILLYVSRYIGSMLSLFILLEIIYYFAPNKKLSFKACLPGALFATIAWFALSLIFSIYAANFANFTNTYGSIGGVVALLVWLYWSSIIILLGGEINAALIKQGSNKGTGTLFDKNKQGDRNPV